MNMYNDILDLSVVMRHLEFVLENWKFRHIIARYNYLGK